MTIRVSARFLLCVAVLAVVAPAGCGGSSGKQATQGTPIDMGPPPKPAVVVLGDSLTEGQGLLASQAYPARLQAKLAEDGLDVDVENAGSSGDTTAGGLRRLEWILKPNVRILMVALGANDALRGISADDTRQNLSQIISHARAKGVLVMLIGMQAPPNLGIEYQSAFASAFAQVVRDNRRIVYVPFLLEGVAGHPELNQADGAHPNELGMQVIADLLYPRLRKMVDEALSTGGGLSDR